MTSKMVVEVLESWGHMTVRGTLHCVNPAYHTLYQLISVIWYCGSTPAGAATDQSDTVT